MIKKIVLFSIIVCICAVGFRAVAVEYNFSLSDFAVFSAEPDSKDVEIIQYPQLNGWFSHVFNDTADLIVSAGLRFKWTHLPQNNLEFIPFLGHTALNLHFTGPTVLPSINLSLGRIIAADTSGKLFSGLMDGVSSSFVFSSGVRLGVSAAYTGLVLLDDLDVFKTEYNKKNPVLYTITGNKPTEYAPPRVLTTLSLSNMSALRGRLLFSAELIGSFDTQPEWIHTQHVVVNLNATILPGLFYSNLYAIASLAEQKTQIAVSAGFAAGGMLNVLIPIKKRGVSDKIFAGIDFASGKSIGTFYPVLSTSLSQNADLPFSGIMRITFGNSLRLFTFTAHADAAVYLTEGVSYFGSEVSLRLAWALAADFQLLASGSYLVPAQITLHDTWTTGIGFLFNF